MKDDDGLTLIHIACFEGERDCLEIFLRNGASVHIRSSVGWTPLHAATLGGKLNVVEYLLAECSADPLAKDEMGCVAPDLTMDKEILNILTKFSDEIKTRRELERLAITFEQKSKRNTYCFEIIEKETADISSNLTRAQSMFVNANKAKQIREQYKTKSQTIGGLSQVTSDIPSVAFPEWKLSRQNSAPLSKVRARNLENRTQSGLVNSSATNSPSSTRLLRSKERSRSRESRNRDSGVFDDDLNDDSSSERSVRLSTPDIPEEQQKLTFSTAKS